jgi:hypothetical protein
MSNLKSESLNLLNERITLKHCGVRYTIVEHFTDESSQQIIEVNGKQYVIKYKTPEERKTPADVFCIFVDGIKYPSFGKFLKLIRG